MPSDLDIARAAKLAPIVDIAGTLGLEEQHLELYGRHKAKVRADGTLIGDDIKGSIHQVGAHLEGAPSCNGWTYWCFKRDGKTVPIDVLRQQIRAELQN